MLEMMGVLCLVILIFYASYPSKVIRLERKVARLENKQKGEFAMSKMIKDLIGNRCKLTYDDGSQFAWIYTILDTDDEWVKVTYEDKKGVSKTQIIRIDTIKKVDLI